MTPTVVVDASALIEVLTSNPPQRELTRHLFATTAAAPEVMDAEVLNALRKMTLRGRLSAAEGAAALRRAQEAPIVRVPHRPLMQRAFEFRRTVSGHDALYVALAERFEVPLVTCDKRLAGASGHDVEIELYVPS